MDVRNILEIYGTGGKMQKAIHKNKVIWEPDRRIPVMVLFQEIEYKGAPPITEEAVRKCLENSKFRIAYIDGYRTEKDFSRLGYGVNKIFKSNPHFEAFICAESHYTLATLALGQSKLNKKVPYHIFEDEMKKEIGPVLYAKYIQPAKDKMAKNDVDNLITLFHGNRDLIMREKS